VKPEGSDDPLGLVQLGRVMDVPSRWVLLAVGAWVFWRMRSLGWSIPWAWVVGGYALVATIVTAFWLSRTDRRYIPDKGMGRLSAFVVYAAYAVDAFFAATLIWCDGGLSSPLYLLFTLLALKAVAFAGVARTARPTPMPEFQNLQDFGSLALPGMVWVPFAFGPLYTVALRLAAGNFAFLADRVFLDRYLLLWAWLAGLVVVAHKLAQRTAQAAALESALVQQQLALAQKTEVLQRTATDLGDRVQELRSLQEVAKALASTLRAEETLQVIVERLRGVTGSSHCAVALLEAENTPAARQIQNLKSAIRNENVPGKEWEDGYLDGTLAGEGGGVQPFYLPLAAEPPTLEALRENRSVRARPAGTGRTPLGQLLGDKTYVVTPLISRGQPIGTLYLAENGSAAAGAKIEQLVASFAYFAATAIENARLYGDAWEKRRELEAVLAGIGDGVVVADPDLRLVLVNPVARNILGLVESRAGGEEESSAGAAYPASGEGFASAPGNIANGGLRGDDASAAFMELLAETLQSQREVIRELDLRNVPAGGGEGEPTAAGIEDHTGSKTGAEGVAGNGKRTYGALASPVLNTDGEVSGVVAVLRDITAQKELERMKSNFLSVVSHELRTPLHSIKGFVEIILMGKTGPVTELQEDFLKTVRTQTTVLQRMIDDLLEFSRMEAGRVKLHLAEVSLPAVAHAVVMKLAPLAEEAGLQLYLALPDDLPEINGDRVRLEQVLTNLVENAIKFTPSGGQIHVSGERAGDRVRLTITDTGIGIPPAEQGKIFDRFYQVDGSERRAYRGTGLGLSICKHIVERHNGRVWVESDGVPGHGSRFHVELPVELKLPEEPTIDFV
jgi:signal transduction histidine kinase